MKRPVRTPMKTGYRVKYRYDGEIRAAETREHPCKYLKVAAFAIAVLTIFAGLAAVVSGLGA